MKHTMVGEFLWSTTNATNDSPTVQRFRCNSIHNPMELPGGRVDGGDPPTSYFQTMANLYNHWRVVGSRIVIQFTGESPSNPAERQIFRICTFVDDDQNVGDQSMDEMAMRPGSFHKQIALTANGTARFSRKWQIKKYFGSRYPVNTLTGTSTTNPSELSYFIVAIANLGYVNDQRPLHATVTMTFDVIWTEPGDSIV